MGSVDPVVLASAHNLVIIYNEFVHGHLFPVSNRLCLQAVSRYQLTPLYVAEYIIFPPDSPTLVGAMVKRNGIVNEAAEIRCSRGKPLYLSYYKKLYLVNKIYACMTLCDSFIES